jgi:hypothetical protein
MVLDDRLLKQKSQLLLHSTLIEPSEIRELTTIQPQIVFSDVQPKETVLYPIAGLSKYGPYDYNTTDPYVKRKINAIEIYVFYPEKENAVKSRLEDLITYLRDGYFETRGRGRDATFRSLEREFRLNVRYPPPSEFISYQPGKLAEKLRSLNIIYETSRRGTFPIVIVGGTTHKSVRVNREQYLEVKSDFTKYDIPCQYASFYGYEEGGVGILYGVKDYNNPFGYSLWNFALNIYGKLGGLAWIIRQKTTPQIDLSIGLRFARVSSNGEKGHYYIGYATILDRFGRWVGLATTDPFEVVLDDVATKGMVIPRPIMESIIKSALDRAESDPRTKDIFDLKKTFNLSIFHLFRFDPENEVPGILSAIQSKIPSKEFKVGLISVIDNSSLLLFESTTQSMNIKRGKAIQLNANSFVLYTAGRELGPFTYPIIASVQNFGEKNCVFKELKQACNHILELSSLHWQTTIANTTRLPSPLIFAHNIAKLSAYGIKPEKDSWLWKTLWFI